MTTKETLINQIQDRVSVMLNCVEIALIEQAIERPNINSLHLMYLIIRRKLKIKLQPEVNITRLMYINNKELIDNHNAQI